MKKVGMIPAPADHLSPTSGVRSGARCLATPLLAAGLMLCAGSAHAQAPTVWGSASPNNVKADTGKVTLSWGSSGADSCEHQGAAIPAGGSVEAGPYAAGTHSVTFSCANGAGTTSHTISWTVWAPPTLGSFSLSAGTIYQNESVTASWRSTGANARHLSTGGGARPPIRARPSRPGVSVPARSAVRCVARVTAAPPTLFRSV